MVTNWPLAKYLLSGYLAFFYINIPQSENKISTEQPFWNCLLSDIAKYVKQKQDRWKKLSPKQTYELFVVSRSRNERLDHNYRYQMLRNKFNSDV